jgi:hypothetical protein
VAIVVVGGSGRGVGKTALVCGLIAALPEFRWTAVKITAHSHSRLPSIWEATDAGQESDTARYLAAGARRAFLLTAADCDLAQRLRELQPELDPHADILFESNRVLQHLRPGLCLLVRGGAAPEQRKRSFQLAERYADAWVSKAGADRILVDWPATTGQDQKPIFQLASFERIPPRMLAWLLERLAAQP